VGCHCTRLTEAEAHDVRLHRLRALSSQFAGKRLARAGEGGLLPPAVAQMLRTRNQAEEEYRAGHVYLILSRELLRQAEGVFLLLEYWGGEALYGLHEDDPHVAAALRSVGVPCLVEAPPAGAIYGYCSPGARAMRVFLAARASRSGS
jgi:hypothetical protein